MQIIKISYCIILFLQCICSSFLLGNNWYIGSSIALNLNHVVEPWLEAKNGYYYYLPTINHALLFKKNNGEKSQVETGIMRLKTGMSIREEGFPPFSNTMLAVPLNFHLKLLPLSSKINFYVTVGTTAGYSIKQNKGYGRILSASEVLFQPFYIAANSGFEFNINISSRVHLGISSNFLIQLNKGKTNYFPERGRQVSGGISVAGYYNFGKYNELPETQLPDTSRNKKNFKNAVALDLLGVAGAYSLNYERILFKRKLMRIATNIGIEYIPTHAVFFPASSYGIFGYSPHYLEAGIGILSGYFLGSYMANFEKGTDGGYVATDQVYVPAYYQATAKMMLIGYRFEHTKGFLFKIRYTPYLERQRFFTGEKGLLFYHHFGGISIGWAF